MLNDTEFSKPAVENPDTDFNAGAEPPAAAPPIRFGRLALCVATASALALGVVGTVAYGVWFNHDQQAYADAMARARQALGTAASAAAGPALAKSIALPRSAAFAAAPQSAPAAGSMQAPAVKPVATGAQVTAIASATTGAQATADPPATTQTQAAAAAPDGEEGGKLASWSGPVTRLPEPTVTETVVADATTALAASSAPAVAPSSPAPQQLASSRPSRDARLAQQDRRATSAANARHKGSLFARMGSFFRRVSYRQHDTGSRQDIYSHP